jgi:YidC/Oxa1 family membrane protein insertase
MDNLRFVLFVFFVFLSYELWYAWQQDYGPKPAQVAGSQAPGQAAPGSAPPASASQAVSPSSGAVPAAPGGEVSQGRRIKVVTDALNLEIDANGGDIRQVDLTNYPLNKDKPEPVRLLDDQAATLFVAQSGFLGEAGTVPNHHVPWTAAATEYRLAEGQDELRVPLTWTDGKGVQVTKTYAFKRGSYLVGMEQEVSNRSENVWKGAQYTQLQRKEPEKKAGSAFSASSADRAYVGGVLYTPEDKYEKISFDDMQDKNLKRDSKSGWVAMIQHYFMAAWIPADGVDEHFYTQSAGEKRYVIGVLSPAVEVEPGATQKLEARLYAGPKLQRVLENVTPGLELTVDFGSLTFIAKPIFWLIEQFHKLFNNWGWAIIFATLVIKLLFYKLSESSYRSMANMRKLQPKLQLLKEQYGEDKQKYNMAMMELYRKEKVNPLGGCLPILLQLPVFISLYWVLVEAVELRQAPFIFWLQDLSSRDPYFILPIVYGVSMFIQQQLNPQPQDPIQAQVMKWFPLMFTFFFAFFPSGLVLYWVVNNVLSIVQQYVITKQIEKTA